MHNLFNEKFVSYREAAWHQLGLVIQEEANAKEAFEMIGTYDVEVVDLGIVGEDAKAFWDLPVPSRAIVRHPVGDDPAQIFGIVGPDYVLVTPKEACEIWDESVGRPIETMGALGKGETFFVTTKLPDYAVNGDEISNNLLMMLPMYGGAANEIMLTPVRVVCQNTLILGRALGSDLLRVVHNEEVHDNMRDWLADAYERAVWRSTALKEVFETLAGVQVDKPSEDLILKAAYPDPKRPREDAPPSVMETRYEWYESNVKSVEKSRTNASNLFHGLGTGMDSLAAKGTAWGLYNAVVEVEDYRRGGTVRSSKENALVGARASAKSAAFDKAIEIYIPDYVLPKFPAIEA